MALMAGRDPPVRSGDLVKHMVNLYHVCTCLFHSRAMRSCGLNDLMYRPNFRHHNKAGLGWLLLAWGGGCARKDVQARQIGCRFCLAASTIGDSDGGSSNVITNVRMVTMAVTGHSENVRRRRIGRILEHSRVKS